MSAVTPYLEQKPAERGKRDHGMDEFVVHESDLAGLGEAPKKAKKDKGPVDPLAKPHTELTRLLWARTLVAKALVGAKFKLEEGEGGALMVAVTPAVGRDTIPWSFSSQPLRRFSLFSENSKMACPTWDLPAGVMNLGGSCPGAAFAQSTVSERMLASNTDLSSPDYGQVQNAANDKRLAFLIDEVQKDWARLPASQRGAPVLNLNSTVCTRCYAVGGKYGEAVVQFAEVARLAMVNAMLRSGGERRLVDLLVHALEKTKMSWKSKDVARHGIRPVRVHSSGDFFSQQYASMWLKVAQRLHKRAQLAQARGLDYAPVVLWAPTRTHVLPEWNKFWRDNQKAGNIPPNFIIRPSAYSVGDPAPYTKRPSPTGSKGTSVLFKADAEKRMKEPRAGQGEMGDGSKFDFQCGVYALQKGDKTCVSSIAPDGQVGCRACWKRPDLSVNYVIH